MSALQARPDYSIENWLVVVTSPSGGVADNSGENVYEMKDRNMFAMYHNYRSVSYTHLDVYKRQCMGNLFIRGGHL